MITTKLLQDQYIKVGLINTRYWSAGTKGSYVVLLHGAGGTVEVWEKNIQVLAQYHQVVAFDMVGTGLSDKPIAKYSLDYQSKTLIIWGREDAVFPVAHAQVATEGIPNAQLQIFEKCGHWAHVEYPETFNQLVLKFLGDF